MRCSEYREALSASLDGELGEKERTELERHLSDCAECRAHGDVLRQLRLRLQAWPDEAPGAATSTAHPTSAASPHPIRRWLATAAALLIVASGGFVAGRNSATPAIDPGASSTEPTSPSARRAVLYTESTIVVPESNTVYSSAVLDLER